MILKAENILGGCMITAAFTEDPSRNEGVSVLTTAEAMMFCTAIEKRLGFNKVDDLALLWSNDGATVLIQASHCECIGRSLDQLVQYIRSRSTSLWQLGADPT